MLNYILDELKKIMAIDSPSGFTRKAADYIMQQLREFGFEPELTRKLCALLSRRRRQPGCLLCTH